MSSIILVIDDHPAIGFVIQVAAQSLPGCSVMYAQDGLAGLDLLRSHCEDIVLVVLDIFMPGLDGLDICAQIRAMKPDMAILPFTSATEALTLSYLSEMGCADAMPKDIEPEHIPRRLMHAKRHRHPSVQPAQAVLHRLQKIVADREREERERNNHAVPFRVCLCISSRVTRVGLREVVEAAGGSVQVETISSQELRVVLQRSLSTTIAVLTTPDELAQVVELTTLFNVPLIVVVRHLLHGIELVPDERVRGLLVENDPSLLVQMREALTAVSRGIRSIAPLLRNPFGTTTLTPQETNVLLMIAQGLSIDKMAQRLNCSPRTINTHRAHIRDELGVADLNPAVVRDWMEHHILSQLNTHG